VLITQNLNQFQPINRTLRKQTQGYGYQSTQKRFYIVSPDTDVYHIGLPLHLGDKDEINITGSNHKRILSLSNLKYNLISDPDLSSVSPSLLPKIMQTLYAATGCDYTSFFSGLGKTTLMKCFFSMQNL
jgi:hypothetical protein